MLDEVNNLNPNIKLVRQLGTNVSFLDLFIENKIDTLVTSVFHKQAAEPYIVPFKSDHPRQIFKNVIGCVLKRAVQYLSTLAAFRAEHRSIKLMLLYKGVYVSFPSELPISDVLPTFHTQNVFVRLRYLLLNRPVIR